MVFDAAKTSYDKLLSIFWENHDPTQHMRQGNDTGTQYRSAIYTTTAAQQTTAERSRDEYQRALDAAGHGSHHDRDQARRALLLRRELPPAVPRAEPERLLRPRRDRGLVPGRPGVWRGLIPRGPAGSSISSGENRRWSRSCTTLAPVGRTHGARLIRQQRSEPGDWAGDLSFSSSLWTKRCRHYRHGFADGRAAIERRRFPVAHLDTQRSPGVDGGQHPTGDRPEPQRVPPPGPEAQVLATDDRLYRAGNRVFGTQAVGERPGKMRSGDRAQTRSRSAWPRRRRRAPRSRDDATSTILASCRRARTCQHVLPRLDGRPGWSRTTYVVDNAAQLLSGLVAMAMCAVAAHRRRQRWTGWALLAASLLVAVFGNALWCYYNIILSGGVVKSFVVGDVCGALALPLAVIGVLTLPGARTPRPPACGGCSTAC